MTSRFNTGLRRAGYTSIDNALNSEGPIYVLNNTEPKALLICSVTDPSSGKVHNLNFYRTFIPFCLTDMVPREVIRSSIQVRTYLQKGVLKLLSEEEALVILESQEGLEEMERLYISQFSQGSAMTDQKQEMLDRQSDSERALGTIGIQNPGVDKSQLNLHPKVQTWEVRVRAGELDGSNLLSELRIHANEFTAEDLRFLLTAQFPQEAKDFASKNLEDKKYKTSRTPTALGAGPTGFTNTTYERPTRDVDGGFDVDVK